MLAPVDRNLAADEIEHVLRDSGAGVYIDGVEGYDALVEGASEAPRGAGAAETTTRSC